MKKLLLLIILSLFALHRSQSQEWFPQGATWTYGYFSSLGPFYSEHPRYYQVGEDTIVLGKSCKQILSSIDPSGPFVSISSFRYQDSGRVYYLEYPNDTTWNLFYDFNKQVGDTIFFPQFQFLECPSMNLVDYYIIIYNTSEIILGSDTLKTYQAHPMNSCVVGFGEFGTSAIERISGGEVTWYGGDVWDFGPLGLRCYNDSILGLYKSPWFSLDCDTTISNNVGLKDKLSPNSIQIFPNPSSNVLNIQIKDISYQTLNFKIFDLQGKFLKQIEIHQYSQAIDVSEFKPGLYIYEIESEGQFLRNKLIIE